MIAVNRRQTFGLHIARLNRQPQKIIEDIMSSNPFLSTWLHHGRRMRTKGQRVQKANVVLELPQLFQPIEHLIIRHVRHHLTCFTCFTSSLEKRELKKK